MDMSVNQKLPVPWQKLKLKGLMGGLWWTREEVVMAIYIYISKYNIIYFCGHYISRVFVPSDQTHSHSLKALQRRSQSLPLLLP